MEKRLCQNCKLEFIIEPEDFDFYKRLKVPPPTFCPDCRRQRRLAWFNLVNLFHRNCDLCGERFVSMYPKEAPYKIYCSKCWWSDKWDWRDYGREYDFSRSFFEQFNELLRVVPILGISNNTPTTENSPYNNGVGHVKNCYLIFDASHCEDSAYGLQMVRNKNILNCSMAMDCENCYDCMNLFKSSGCIGTRGNIRFCLDSAFLRDCDNCTSCFMCANLKNAKYNFKNQPMTKDAYEEKVAGYVLHTRSGYESAEREAREFWKTLPPRPAYDTMSQNVTGSYVFNSKNCKECYDVTDAEDCAYCLSFFESGNKNCYDISRFGGKMENTYECSVVGELCAGILFCDESGIGLQNAEYSKLAIGGSNNFGCVSVRKGNYVILNKEYSSEAYKETRKKIIEHMNEMPYTDKKGNIYKYGEFFPMEFSPASYRTTFADLFYPKTDEELANEGLHILSEKKNEHAVTMTGKNIPDDIRNVSEGILSEVIECGFCHKGFKIVPMELAFLRMRELPLPHECPFCRIRRKMLLWVDNMTLKDRVCDKCGVDFKTHYSKERAPKILCKSCYQSEFS